MKLGRLNDVPVVGHFISLIINSCCYTYLCYVFNSTKIILTNKDSGIE